jgi:hypothetical protein
MPLQEYEYQVYSKYFTMTNNLDSVTTRIIELLKEDKELHDAAVRLIHAYAEKQEIANVEKKRKRQHETSNSIIKEFKTWKQKKKQNKHAITQVEIS